MTKIVIYNGYGKFDLPHRFIIEYAKTTNRIVNTYGFNFDTETYFRMYINDCVDVLDFGSGVEYITRSEDVLDYDTGSYFMFIPQFCIERTDPILIDILEKYPKLTKISNLKIVEIPDDVDWYIEEDDSGAEWVAERHRTWS